MQWEQGYWNTNLTLNQPEIGDIVKGWREVLDSFDDSDDDNDNYKLVRTNAYFLVGWEASPSIWVVSNACNKK